MTTAGEPPPPLPPGDDPFALLGIVEDASDRDIRKAYAKRIKVYRPDRAPAEFQRIQRAFEMLTAGRVLELPRSAAVPEPEDQAADVADVGKVMSAAFVEIQAAAERGDSGEVDRLIGGLLDQKVPLDQLFADPDNHDLLLRSSAITWTRLGDRDRAGRWAIWNQAFDRAYADNPVRARTMLDDPELRHAVADDPSIAIMVLDRFASLAWRGELRPVVELFETYRAQLPGHSVVEHRADGVLLHFEASAQLKDVKLPPVLATLPELIVKTAIGSHDGERAAAASLRDTLAADLPTTLAQLEAWAKANQHGAQPALRELLVHALPSYRVRLDAMPKPRFNALTKQLHKAGKRPWTPQTSAWLAGALLLTIVSLPYGLVIPIALIAYVLATEERRYRTEIAPAVSLALLAVPVQIGVVTRWARINPKLCGRLGRFDVGLDNDWGLYMFSLLASYTAEIGALDSHLDGAD